MSDKKRRVEIWVDHGVDLTTMGGADKRELPPHLQPTEHMIDMGELRAQERETMDRLRAMGVEFEEDGEGGDES